MLKPIRNTAILLVFALMTCGCGSGQKISLTGNGVTPTAPGLGLSTSSINFGDVTTGTVATQTVTVSSTGTSPLVITAITVAGPEFTVSGITIPETLQPAATAQLLVAFDPTVAGTANGSVTIISNAFTSPMNAPTLTGAGVVAGNSVSLTWSAPTSSPDPVATYSVYRATHGTYTYTLTQAGLTTTSYLDTTVTAGSYDYVVESVDASGVSSAPSNVATATVP